MPGQITSQQNKRIKTLVKLRQRRFRDSQRLMVVEGIREAHLALANHMVPREAYICPPLLEGAEGAELTAMLWQLARDGSTHLFEVTPAVYEKIAYRGQSGGVLLVLPFLVQDLQRLRPGPIPFMVIIENVEKPGNLGAILRTADAAGVDAVIISSQEAAGGTDIHNPNVVRASLGALFTVPVVEARNEEVLDWLHQNQVRIVASSPAAHTPYTEVDMTGPVALVMGSEAQGLSDFWLSAADEQVSIPMRGVVDSLNLATSTAVLMFEIVRQRTKRE